MKICVIFNPAARGEKARHFREHLAALSADCSLKPTLSAGGGRLLAAEAVREGFEVIVAGGGDGTVFEVLNGIGDEPDGFSRVRLGVLPLGTVNVFARELNLPTHFELAWKIIMQGRESRIDLGEAECVFDGQPRHCFFVHMAGAGVDAHAIELVDWEQKKRYGQIAYVLAGMKAMSRAKTQIAVTNGQETLAGEQVLLGNGLRYGGNFRLFPLANPRDGLLDATILTRANWGTLLQGTWHLWNNRLYACKGIKHLRGETLSLYSATPVAFHVEGELIGHLPAKCSVRREALRIVVP